MPSRADAAAGTGAADRNRSAMPTATHAASAVTTPTVEPPVETRCSYA
jgi:hypothetical protein